MEESGNRNVMRIWMRDTVGGKHEEEAEREKGRCGVLGAVDRTLSLSFPLSPLAPDQ